MATTTINTYSEGTGVQFDPNVNGLVLPDAVLVSTDDSAVLLNDGQLLTVYGLVYGDDSGIQADTNAGGSIFVAETGRISGGANGIRIEADLSGFAAVRSLINNGEITGLSDDGVDAQGSGFSLVNNGSISGSYGIYFSDSNADNVEIVNTGIVSATSAEGFGIYLSVNSGGVLQNSGTITNGVDTYGEIEGVRLINTGTIGADSGGNAVDMTSLLGDTVHNTGIIAGAVNTSDGADTVRNTGDILGDVNLGSDADLYRAGTRGTVEGQVQGGGGDDTLLGGGDADDMDGGADDDLIRGGAGDDTLAGGGGNDELDFGSGDDTYFAGNSDGNDDLDGGDGIDTYDARDVTTSVTIRLHEQRATGTGIGIDSVQFFENAFGGSGADSIGGDAGRNVLKGNGGADVLNGLEGNDRLLGNAGIDILVGNIGRDVMTGGADADTFDFNNVTDSGVGDSNRDIITDFTQGADKIDLATIDANTLAAGNQAFTFIGAGAFTSVAGQLRFANSAAAQYTTVEGDVNGDGKADFSIGLFGNIIMVAGDFVL